MSKELPGLVVADDVKDKIEDVHFGAQRYAEYLDYREVSAENIASLSLLLTDKDINPLAIANYEPPHRILGTQDEGHRIRISTRLSPDINKQGMVLRHETEHFIREVRRTPRQKRLNLAAKSAVFGTGVVGCAALFGINSAEAVAQATGHSSETLQIGATTVAALGGIAFGVAGGTGAFIMLKSLSPEELAAQWAQIKQADALPDGTLQVLFR